MPTADDCPRCGFPEKEHHCRVRGCVAHHGCPGPAVDWRAEVLQRRKDDEVHARWLADSVALRLRCEAFAALLAEARSYVGNRAPAVLIVDLIQRIDAALRGDK